MKIIEPSAELFDEINPAEILHKLEVCGKVSRQSKLGDAENFVRSIIKRGHESVLEHVSLTFKIICDRAIMAELTRHRLASFTVESTRYVNYKDGLTFIKGTPEFGTRLHLLRDIEDEYRLLIESGEPPELARAVLPQCTATTIYMTANLREWRHVLKLRTDKAAHPQMRHIMNQILAVFKEKLPVIVEDISND